MDKHIKTLEQVEFKDIFDRLETAGLTKADVGREIKISRSAVGMILKGERNPRPATLSMMRDLDNRFKKAKEHGEEIETREESLGRLYNTLKMLERHDPPKFEVVKSVIESLAPSPPKSSPKSKPPTEINTGTAADDPDGPLTEQEQKNVDEVTRKALNLIGAKIGKGQATPDPAPATKPTSRGRGRKHAARDN